MRAITRGIMGLALICAPLAVADAAVLCATRKGAVKLRESCRARETPVDAVAVGLQGPPGEPGSRGDAGPRGEPGPSAHTFADTFTDGIVLGTDDVVVASTAEQLPAGGGAVGGSLTVAAAVRYTSVAAVRVRTEGTGAYECALQVAVNDNPFFELDRVATSEDVLRFGVPDGTFLGDAGFTANYRVVCKGDPARSVQRTQLSVVIAYNPY
jgi:hypothetical protein